MALGLTALALVAFHASGPEEWVLDGETLIPDNPCVRGDVGWGELWWSNYWGSFAFAGLWRPLTMATFRVEHTVLGFGDDPTGYVAVNLGLHVLVVLLLWQVGAVLTANSWVGAWAAALFAVHPVATEVVPNVVGSADLLATASLLGSLLLWERYRGTRRVRWLACVVLVWGLGLLAKESAVVVPGALVLWDLARDGLPLPHAVARLLRARIVPYAVLAAFGVAWLWFRGVVLAPHGEPFYSALDNPLLLLSAPVRALNAFALLGRYLVQAVWPVRLCADYSFVSLPTVRSALDPTFLFGLLVVLALLAAAGLSLGRKPGVAFGLPLFLGALLPVCNLVLPIGTIRGDRLLYLPLTGLVVAVVTLADAAASRIGGDRTRRVTRNAVVGLAVLAMLAVTVPRTRDWHTNVGLWQDTVAKAPDNAKARFNLATSLLEITPGSSEDELSEVLTQLERAVEVSRRLPGDEFSGPWVNLGSVYLRIAESEYDQGRMTEAARRHLERAVTVLAEGVRRSQQQGRRYASWRKAVDARAKSLGGFRPAFGDPRLHLVLATALERLGRFDEARDQLRYCLQVEPSNPTPYLRLALSYARAGDSRNAQSLLKMAASFPRRSQEDEALTARVVALLQSPGAG